MSKISQYTQALAAKLTDLFVIAQDDNGALSTKSVTTSQIGDAINGTQTFASLTTTDKTITGAINELDGKTAGNIPLGTDFSDPTSTAGALGDLTTLTTTDKSSAVGAINEVNANKPTNTTASPYLKAVFSNNVTKTVGAGADVAVLGSDINLSQAGYTPIAICSMYSTSPAIVFRSFDCRIVSGSSTFCVLHNITNASASVTVNFVILFMRNSN